MNEEEDKEEEYLSKIKCNNKQAATIIDI